MAKKARKDHPSDDGRRGAKPQSAKKKVRLASPRKKAARKTSKAKVSPANSLGAKDSRFVKDRRRLLYLCRTIKSRIEQETSPDSVGAIGGLLREFEETGLAQRLGFGTPPLVWAERPEPTGRLVNLLIWNGPHSEGGGELLLSTEFTSEANGKRMPGLPMPAHQDENRRFLAALLEHWILAGEGLEEPEV